MDFFLSGLPCEAMHRWDSHATSSEILIPKDKRLWKLFLPNAISWRASWYRTLERHSLAVFDATEAVPLEHSVKEFPLSAKHSFRTDLKPCGLRFFPISTTASCYNNEMHPIAVLETMFSAIFICPFRTIAGSPPWELERLLNLPVLRAFLLFRDQRKSYPLGGG